MPSMAPLLRASAAFAAVASLASAAAAGEGGVAETPSACRPGTEAGERALLLQTKREVAAVEPGARSLDEFDWDASTGCAGGLDRHLAAVRSAGFALPRDGEHTPQVGVEGGASHDEAKALAALARAELATNATSKVICQTGFNYGVSAFAFLCGTSAKLYSWDLGEHAYVHPAHASLNANFPGRHVLSLGDSTQTLAAAPSSTDLLIPQGERCGVVFVDGGHNLEVARADIHNFAKLASPGALLIVDDCAKPGSEGYSIPPVDDAFAGALQDGTIVAGETLRTPGQAGRAMCVGRFS